MSPSDRLSGHTDRDPEAYPEEYLKAEFDKSTRSPPYGPAWPGGFRVGAGALLLFFGAFLVILVVASFAGPFGLLVSAALTALAIVGLSLLMWSGLARYIGSSGPSDVVERRRRRQP